jgi:adenosylcobinamide-GDP ribazoletransferase
MAGHRRHRDAAALTVRRAIAFLTPLGGAAEPDAATMSWFPLVGALIGASVGVVWWTAAQVWPPLVAAALAVIADLALTGMLHMDGLVDSADGLLPHLTRDRRLAVMREPTIGAYGAIVAVAFVVTRVVVLSSIEPNVVLLAAVWAAARTAMAVAARALPYARAGGGLATAMLGGNPYAVAAYGLVGALALGGIADGPVGLGSVAACVAASAGVMAFACRRIGGFTGDVLGAAGVVGETVALLVVAARP